MTSQTLAPDEIESFSERGLDAPGITTGSPRLRRVRPLSPVPTYVGMIVVVLGLVLIGIAWSRVAGEANVSRQVPYLVSGGIFGLAVVLIGLTTVNIASKRRETVLREQQTRLLADAVEQLGRVLGDDLPYQQR